MASPPSKLYKFQPFGPHTGLNLVMLVEKGCLYLPKKSALNDPTDCEPNILIDESIPALKEALVKIASLKPAVAYFSKAAREAFEVLEKAENEPTQAIPTRGEPGGLGSLLSLGNWFEVSPEQKAKSLIETFIKSEIGMPGVFSMSAAWNISQMWSYYADAHRGFCLELDGLGSDPNMLVERVNYADKRPQIVLDDIIAVYSGKSQSKRTLSSIYCEKSNAWRDELEYRIVARNSLELSSRCELSLPSGDFYHFQKARVSAIYFGLRCEQQNIQFATDLIASRVPKASQPKYFTVHQSADSYDLEKGALKGRAALMIPPSRPLIQSPDEGSDQTTSLLASLFAASK